MPWPAMPDANARPALILLRFGVRALRITASTVALVALLRQQWVAAGTFSLAWLLILGAPRLVPLLAEEPTDPDDKQQS